MFTCSTAVLVCVFLLHRMLVLRFYRLRYAQDPDIPEFSNSQRNCGSEPKHARLFRSFVCARPRLFAFRRRPRRVLSPDLKMSAATPQRVGRNIFAESTLAAASCSLSSTARGVVLDPPNRHHFLKRNSVMLHLPFHAYNLETTFQCAHATTYVDHEFAGNLDFRRCAPWILPQHRYDCTEILAEWANLRCQALFPAKGIDHARRSDVILSPDPRAWEQLVQNSSSNPTSVAALAGGSPERAVRIARDRWNEGGPLTNGDNALRYTDHPTAEAVGRALSRLAILRDAVLVPGRAPPGKNGSMFDNFEAKNSSRSGR